MEIVYKNLSELKPYENNPRINDGGVKYVVNSIKSYGFKIPMVVDKNNVIVCGHTRYKAAQELGMDKVPCIVADDLTDDQIKAFRIADNKVADFSLWDNKLLLQELDFLPDDLFTGFDISETFNELLDERIIPSWRKILTGLFGGLFLRVKTSQKLRRSTNCGRGLMAKILVVEISGKRPGGVSARPTEKMEITYDHLIISNNSEGYETEWDIVNVPEDYVEWYKENVRMSETAWYAPMNRSYAIKYAREHGYDYLVQLDDNITALEIVYQIKEDGILHKYRRGGGGQDMVNDFISFMGVVADNTNAAMVGMQLNGSASPHADFLGERYCYSFFLLDLKSCPDIFHGDFEDDIEYRMKCAEMGLPIIKIMPFRYSKKGQLSSKDESGNRAAYTKAGLKRGEHMRVLHGDLYSCGYSYKTASTTTKTDGQFFKHRVKSFKVGTQTKGTEQINRAFLELLKKYAEPHEDRAIIKEKRLRSRKK